MKYHIAVFSYQNKTASTVDFCPDELALELCSIDGLTEINIKHKGPFDMKRLEDHAVARTPLSLKKLGKILHK